MILPRKKTRWCLFVWNTEPSCLNDVVLKTKSRFDNRWGFNGGRPECRSFSLVSKPYSCVFFECDLIFLLIVAQFHEFGIVGKEERGGLAVLLFEQNCLEVCRGLFARGWRFTRAARSWSTVLTRVAVCESWWFFRGLHMRCRHARINHLAWCPSPLLLSGSEPWKRSLTLSIYFNRWKTCLV